MSLLSGLPNIPGTSILPLNVSPKMKITVSDLIVRRFLKQIKGNVLIIPKDDLVYFWNNRKNTH
jgi:hypothetical protein